MKERLLTLAAEVENELKQLEELRKRLMETERKKHGSEDRDVYEESEALKLHNFYTGCENIFKRIAIMFNGGVPAGEDWHKQLLSIMHLDIPGVRPAVISPELYKGLEEYLRFRHVIRNIYAFEINSERLQKLVDSFDWTFQQFSHEITEFLEFIRTLADEPLNESRLG